MHTASMPLLWIYALIPVCVAAAGAVFTVWRRPSDAVIGAIQHLAAGVIFYAAAGELLPDATRGARVWPLVAGGVVGGAAMLVLRHFAEKARGPVGLIGAAAVDSVIDGLALGLGFQAGARQGLLLAIALAVEFLFLGLSIAAAFGNARAPVRVIGASAGVALMVPLGAALALPVGALDAPWQSAAFAFGLIALLYLVTEELLHEAHQKPETAWGAALFFAGFIGLAAVNQVLGG